MFRFVKILWVALRFGLDEFALPADGRAARVIGALLFFRPLAEPRAVRLRRALERLGPIFVKFGQVLSTRRDLLPPDIADELAKLQDRVPPFPGEIAVAEVERAFGKPIARVFERFDREPVASASVAQVHLAALPGGAEAAVKILRPGMLPVINAECVRQAVRTGLGLKAKINLKSVFDRKNYFYPDLPQGYQISQYKSPIVGEGEVIVDMADGETVRIGIERLHLEQDAGKSLHEQNPEMSLVDLNRAGVALMEIVSKPDLRSAEQAMAFLRKLRSVLRYLGTCDGDMEKGNLRADVNVSVRKPGSPFGTRCEIKNLNSIRFIGQAIDFEARRQIDDQRPR